MQMSKVLVHVRFRTPTGWRNFYLHPDSAYNDDVLKQLRDKFGATEFQIFEPACIFENILVCKRCRCNVEEESEEPLKGLDAVYQEEK